MANDVRITLTDEQKAKIKEGTGKDLGEIEVSSFGSNPAVAAKTPAKFAGKTAAKYAGKTAAKTPGRPQPSSPGRPRPRRREDRSQVRREDRGQVRAGRPQPSPPGSRQRSRRKVRGQIRREVDRLKPASPAVAERRPIPGAPFLRLGLPDDRPHPAVKDPSSAREERRAGRVDSGPPREARKQAPVRVVEFRDGDELPGSLGRAQGVVRQRRPRRRLRSPARSTRCARERSGRAGPGAGQGQAVPARGRSGAAP